MKSIGKDRAVVYVILLVIAVLLYLSYNNLTHKKEKDLADNWLELVHAQKFNDAEKLMTDTAVNDGAWYYIKSGSVKMDDAEFIRVFQNSNAPVIAWFAVNDEVKKDISLEITEIDGKCKIEDILFQIQSKRPSKQ